jgi:glucokinase
MLALTLGTGLGVAMLVDGQLLDPEADGHLAGHLPSRRHDFACFCGLDSCLEPLVSSSRLDDDAARLGVPGWGDIFAASPARASYLDDLGEGLTALVHVFAPRVVVFGGGLAPSLTAWLPQLAERVTTRPTPDYEVRFLTSRLDGYAGAMGAASLSRRPG